MLELIFAAFKTGSATVVNLLFTAVTVKIVAIFTGPTGVGAWSLLRQCQQTAVSIGTASGAVSFVRGTSQLIGSERNQFIRTVAITYLALGACVTLGLILLSARLSLWIGTLNARIFVLLSLPVAISIFRDYVMALLNGLHAIGRLAMAQIAGAAATAMCAYPIARMVADGDYNGFILLMCANGLVSSALATYFIRRADAKIAFAAQPRWALSSFKRFASLAGVMATSGIFSSVVLFSCRALIARYRGIDETGYFDVAWSVGLTYVGLIMNAFGTVYLPKLSSGTDAEQTRLVQYVSKLMVLAMGPLVVMTTLLKPWIVTMFYSNAFMPSLGIFQWLLVADYLKMSTFVFSVVIAVRGYEKAILLGNLMWDSCLLLGVTAILYFHLSSANIGLVVVVLNCFSLIGYKRLLAKALPVHFPVRLWMVWGASLLCVLFATAATWQDTTVHWSSCWIWLLTVAVSLCALTSEDIAAVRKLLLRRSSAD